MPLVYDHNPTGLVVAREGAGESSVRHALKQHDQRLMLDYAIDTDWGKKVWQVLCKTGSDTPPAVVCRWRDEQTGEPLELSHGLVDHVKRLDVNGRGRQIEADAANREMRARLEQDADAEIDWYARQLVKKLKGTSGIVLPRGQYRRRTQFADVTDVR